MNSYLSPSMNDFLSFFPMAFQPGVLRLCNELQKDRINRICMMWFRLRFISLALFIPFCVSAQSGWRYVPTDSLKDLTDVINHIFKKDTLKETFERTKHHIQIGVFPAIGYTLQTGFAAVVSANAVIYKKHRSPKDSTSLPSTISGSISYSQYNQVILPLQTVIYFNNNKTILVSDWRYLKYPSYTYGLGMYTSPADQDLLNFQYLKFHQLLLFQVRPQYVPGCRLRAGLFLGHIRRKSKAWK